MITIPDHYYKNDTIHRVIGREESYGNVSCGFLCKKLRDESNVNTVFEKYGGLLLLSGKGIHKDNNGKEYALYPGCFVQRIPGKIHSTYVEEDGKWLEFFICFGKDVFENMVKMGIATKDEDVLYPGLSYGIIDIFVDLLEQTKRATEEELPLVLFQYQQILYHIYRWHHKNTWEQKLISEDACNLLKSSVTSRMTIQEICEEKGINYENFRKLFKKQMNISPTQYRIKERIGLAKTLLLQQENSIEHISNVLGYSDPFIFSKQFKKLTGVSPLTFRKSY